MTAPLSSFLGSKRWKKIEMLTEDNNLGEADSSSPSMVQMSKAKRGSQKLIITFVKRHVQGLKLYLQMQL